MRGLGENVKPLFVGSSGRWAAEKFAEALKQGKLPSPKQLRTADVLRREEWKAFDAELVRSAGLRMPAVQDLRARGLWQTIANGMAKTVFEYDKIGDVDPAVVSMDGVTRSENDRPEYSSAGIPLPITHKDWNLNIRTLAASRLSGDPLDTEMVQAAGRKVAEETERMLFLGGKTFSGLTLYGLANHPSRNTVSFGTNGNWAQTAKTGENILADVATMITALENDRMGGGPYVIYVSGNVSLKLSEDYKASSDKTIRQRILEVDGVSAIHVADQLTAGNVLMVRATGDVVKMIEGEPLQTVQWDMHGGFQIDMKAFQILVPLVRSDAEGRSGIVHMT